MIIVNQNQDEFVNFENIMCVNITDCQEDGFLISTGFIVGRDDNYRELGYYKTEVRAKEVLQEIVKTYVLTEQYKVEDERTRIGLMMEGVFLYEMPKE